MNRKTARSLFPSLFASFSPTLALSPFVLAAFATLAGCVGIKTKAAEENAVRAAAAEFYVALNILFTGDAEPMKDVWSHADDVTYMGPVGGFQVGWDAVLRDWEAQAALKLGGSVKSANMRVTVGRRLAVTSNYEIGVNTNARGEAQKVSIRATNVFRKEGGRWKMIGHHTDLLPYLAP